MIYPKSLQSLPLTRRYVTKKLSLYEEKSGALLAKGVHFTEENGALVLCDGAKKLEELDGLEGEQRAVYTSSGQLQSVFALGSDRVLREVGGTRQFAGVPDLSVLIGFEGDRGEIFLGVRESGVELLEGGMSFSIKGAAGGDGGCIFCERLVTARGDTVYWSKPLSPQTTWKQSLQEAGHVSLPSDKGKIKALFALKDRVCLVRETGIDLLFMGGDTTAFRFERAPYAGGRIAVESAVLCGDKVIFLSESGLYTFDGTRAKCVKGCGASLIDVEKGAVGVFAKGFYYASVTGKDREKLLFRFSPEEETGCFLGVRADLLVGGKELLFRFEDEWYTLEGRGLPLGGRREAVLYLDRTGLGLSVKRKYLDGVTIEGEGHFEIEARGARGARRCVSGEANRRLCFSAPVKGESFAFRISTSCDHAKIKNLTFYLREENETW